MRKHFLGILFLLICCTNYLAAQVDTAFWFAVPSLSEHCYLADYHLMFSSYNEDANVRISMPATPSFTPKTFSIAKHSFYDYVLAADYTSAESTFSVPYHVISQRGLLIESDAPISCYFQITMQNGEAYTLKGDKALGTDFVLLMQNGHTNGLASTSTLYTNAYSSLQIVATEDNTAVTINPTANSGNSCNTSVINITLNKGETYALRACSKAGASHIAGTVIHSNKPIAVNSTDDTVRPTGGKADLAGDQLVPIDYWDTEYIAVSRRNSFEGLYIFSRASTNVTLGDGTIHSLNAGEVLFVSLANKDVEWISSTEPIGIYHLTGINEVAGTILPGLHCTGSQEIFYKRQAFSVRMLLHIVIRTSNINSMYLNDSQIASSNFHIVNGTGGEWSYANIEVTDLVPLNSSAKISSSNGLFQLGIMDFMRTLDPDNNSVASCTYGYFSNYGTAHEYAEYDSFEDGTIYTWHGHYYPGTTTPMTFYTEGEYTDHLTDINGCDSICVLHLSKMPFPDNVIDVPCTVDPPTNVWSIRRSAISTQDLLDDCSTTMVGDIDGDGQVEIIAPINGESMQYEKIGIFDAQANVKRIINIPGTSIFTNIAVAKVKTGESQYTTLFFFLAYDKYIYAYTPTGTQYWKSNLPFSHNDGELVPIASLSLADFNHDGWSEIYLGSEIFDAATGNKLCAYDGNRGHADRSWKASRQMYQSVAADVIGDSNLELLIGNCACTVNINSRTDATQNSIIQGVVVPTSLMKMEDNSSIPSTDGFTLSADMDGDGKLDAIVMWIDKSNRVLYVYIWNPRDGTILGTRKIVNVSEFGTPNIGDIDNDGNLELNFIIGTQPGETTDTNDRIFSLKYNKSTHSLDVFWTLHHDDASGATGLTLFDFNQDGTKEIVYRDCENLRIINGSMKHHLTGAPVAAPYDLATIPCTSGTATEYPVIADVDADGEAEIVVVGEWKLQVYKSNLEPWAPARKVWNQYAYNITNVNEDLTIPQYQYNNAHKFTDASSVVRQPYNTFLSQVTTINTQGVPFIAAADVNVSTSTTTTYENDSIKIDLSFCNQGDLQVNAPYCITAYKNAYRGSVLFVDTIKAILPIGDCLSHQVGFPISNVCSDKDINSIVIAVNDDGHGIAQHGNQQAECDTTNNRTSVSLPTDFRCDTTKYTPVICATELPYTFTPTGTIFQVGTTSGRTIIPETNKYGCDSIITIDLTVNPTLTGDTTATFCNGTPFIWHGTSYPTGGDYPYTYTSKVTGCDSIVTLHLTQLEPTDSIENVTLCAGGTHTWHGQTFTSSTTITETIPNAAGCDSVCTLNLTILPALTGDTSATFCNGKSFTWHGTQYSIAGHYPYTYTSKVAPYCDSIVTLHLTQLEPTDSIEKVTLCYGESHVWHGQTFTTSTTITETIPNAAGCDSVCTLNLTILPALTGDTSATFCNGTPFIWHDTPYATGGDYQYTYTSKVAPYCDSIVTLHLTQLEPTDSIEVVTICYGGSHTWHGHTYTATTTTTETIDNAVGCDSVCTLKLTVLPAITGDTNMTVCDTLLPVTWRGQSITGAGEYYHTATASSGCDSTITLHVTVETCLTPALTCDTLEATFIVPDICADDDSMYIDITYTKGLPVSYNVTFGADAVAQGFQSSYTGNVRITSSTTASISIPIPNDPTNRQVYPKPNVYSIDISILDTCDAYTTWRSQNFLIHYPSWLTLQRWNDVISLYNERYNGGYVFSQIRWFHEGTLLESRGDHDGYIYQRPTLVYGDAYWAELTRADDGVTITTCPIYPVPMTDSTKMDDVTDPYIIVTPTVVTPSNPTVTVKTNICGEYYVYYVDGHLLDKQNFCPKDNHTFTIDIDPCYVRTGLYILVFYGEEGTIKAVKLLVEP